MQLLGEVFEGSSTVDMATAGVGRELVFGGERDESEAVSVSVAEAEG